MTAPADGNDSVIVRDVDGDDRQGDAQDRRGERNPEMLGDTVKEVVLARPTGVGRALATYEIPIEGRDEWLAAAKRLA